MVSLMAGVPQGSILRPLLFLIYTNNLVDNLECDIHLYADDAVLMMHNRESKEEAFKNMNRDLQRLNEGHKMVYVIQPHEDEIYGSICN